MRIKMQEAFRLNQHDKEFLDIHVKEFMDSHPRDDFGNEAAYEDAFYESLGDAIDSYVQEALDLEEVSARRADAFTDALWAYAAKQAGVANESRKAEERTAAKVPYGARASQEDWKREYDRIKASGYSALAFLQAYLDNDVPNPAIKWTNNGFIGDLVKDMQGLVSMVRESDPNGAAKASQNRTARKVR